MPAALLVSYPAAAGARFDRDYYRATHIPLVDTVFGPHGMTGVTAWFPDDVEPASMAVAMLTFPDAATRDAALASSDASQAFGDIPNFTDIQPVAQRVSGD